MIAESYADGSGKRDFVYLGDIPLAMINVEACAPPLFCLGFILSTLLWRVRLKVRAALATASVFRSSNLWASTVAHEVQVSSTKTEAWISCLRTPPHHFLLQTLHLEQFKKRDDQLYAHLF
ncbi:MAG: hypothetical protein KUG82_16955 [Pseudomonadales bacterium]|nr:hypothetical protein [Pseudomonadales bacterium]